MKPSPRSTSKYPLAWTLASALALSACGKPSGPSDPLTPTPQDQVELDAMNENAPLVEDKITQLKDEPEDTSAGSIKPDVSPVSEATGTVGLVRVRVFPHDHAKSNVPQGRDSVVTSVRLKSTGTCRLKRNGREERTTGLDVTLTTANLSTRPAYVECTGGVTVHRAKGRTAYRYAGIIEASRATYKSGKSYVKLINIIDHEEYLKGVVPTEMSATWPMEALKAQAVAARSYSLAGFNLQTKSVMERVGEQDMVDTIHDQAYVGLNKSDPRSDEAVEETRGIVLLSGKRVAMAFFSADAGGHTESSEGAWGGKALSYCRAKKEPFDYRLNPNSDWTKTITFARLTQYAGGGSAVTGLSVKRNDSGRASRVVYSLSGGKTKSASGTGFASAFGMRSNFITPSVNGKSVVVRGRGFGHGVGMSQWGAKILATHSGWNYRQILEFYYDGTTLLRLVNHTAATNSAPN